MDRIYAAGRRGRLQFEDAIVGGVVPREYMAVEQGLKEAMENGVLAGYPLVDLHAKLTTVPTTVDSSEAAFKVAASYIT